MKAIAEHILVETPNPATVTEGGIHLPQQSDLSNHQHGRVVGVGPDVKNVVEGDIVIFDVDGIRDCVIGKKKHYVVIIEQMVFVALSEEEARENGLSLDFKSDISEPKAVTA